MEHKVEVAKKILTIANDYDGEVYGGFVRDVIVPKINDPNCNVSFKDVDIWFKDPIAVTYFICKLVQNLKIESKSSGLWNKELDYSTNEKDSNFFRNQYCIYSKNELLFHIDVITSDKLPVNDFNVNTVTYKYTDKGFENCQKDYHTEQFITKKIANMFDDYNPVDYNYYQRINRIFFSKGWTVRCFSKHKKLSEFILNNNLNITEGWCDSSWYNYIPIASKAEITPILESSFQPIPNEVKTKITPVLESSYCIPTQDVKSISEETRLDPFDTSDKYMLGLIFNNGLKILEEKIYNNIEDEGLRNIYNLGLEDYRLKIVNLLK